MENDFFKCVGTVLSAFVWSTPWTTNINLFQTFRNAAVFMVNKNLGWMIDFTVISRYLSN